MVKPMGFPEVRPCDRCGPTLQRATETGWRCGGCGRETLADGPTLRDVGRAGLWFLLAVNAALMAYGLWRIFGP